MPAAVLLLAGLVRLGAERRFLAVADGREPAGIHAGPHQRVLYRVRATVSQSQVVLGGTAFVAMSLNRELDVRMLVQELRVALHRRLLVRANRVRVVVEEHVLDAAREEFLLGRPGLGWRWWRRRIHGDSRRRFLGAAFALGNQVIGRRVRRSHLLGAVRLHGANALDADVGCIRCLPTQRGRHPLVDAIGIGGNRSRRRRRRWWRRRRRWWLLLLAGAQHHDGAKNEYQSNPLHLRLFHFLLPAKSCARDSCGWPIPAERADISATTGNARRVRMIFLWLHFCCLLPTPIWLTVATGEGQLLHLGTVGQHGPDLLAS